MPRQSAAPKAGPGQIVHNDQQQCPDRRGPHVHDPCACDPDATVTTDAELAGGAVQAWNTRAHIKQTLAGHWPLTPGQGVVICERCGGAIRRTGTHKAALNYEPLEKS